MTAHTQEVRRLRPQLVWRWLVRLPANILILLVRFYQVFISPLSAPSCRFYPCCSQYSRVSLQRFGAVKGTWLTVRRLLRCHPWNPGGVDHVPAAKPRGVDRN